MIAWGCKNAMPDFSDLDVSHNSIDVSTFTHFCLAFRDNPAVSFLMLSHHSPYAAKKKPFMLSRPLNDSTAKIVAAIPSKFECKWPSFCGKTLKIPVVSDDAVVPDASPMQVDDAPTEAADMSDKASLDVALPEAQPLKYPDHLAGLTRNERRKHLLPWPQKCTSCGFVWGAGSTTISRCETYRSMCKLHNRPCAERFKTMSVPGETGVVLEGEFTSS